MFDYPFHFFLQFFHVHAATLHAIQIVQKQRATTSQVSKIAVMVSLHGLGQDFQQRLSLRPLPGEVAAGVENVDGLPGHGALVVQFIDAVVSALRLPKCTFPNANLRARPMTPACFGLDG